MPRYIVLHYTAMTSASAALERLCDPVHEVSAHYLISQQGEVYPLVDEDRRAWHAGAGAWAGQHDMNSHSIGIELDNDGRSPFPEPLMAALEALVAEILIRHDIPPENVIGHSDMAPGRKIDPGPRFDWARLEAQELARPRAHTTGPDVPAAAEFRALAQAFGYSADVNDAALLEAVRLRFRPHARGPLVSADFGPLGRGEV